MKLEVLNNTMTTGCHGDKTAGAEGGGVGEAHQKMAAALSHLLCSQSVPVVGIRVCLRGEREMGGE